MNSGALSPKSKTKALPPLLAAALLACCVLPFLMSPPGGNPNTGQFSRPSSGDPPPTPAALVTANPLPGVLSLPPATLASSATASPAAQHQPPPPASRNAFSLADLKAQMPQRTDGTFLIDIPALYFSAGDAAARQVMDGQSIETAAQVRRDPATPELLQLTRSLTRCCSADCRAYSVAVKPGASGTSFPDGTWVEVTGTIGYRREIGGYGPVIDVTTIQPIPTPPNPILK